MTHPHNIVWRRDWGLSRAVIRERERAALVMNDWRLKLCCGFNEDILVLSVDISCRQKVVAVSQSPLCDKMSIAAWESLEKETVTLSGRLDQMSHDPRILLSTSTVGWTCWWEYCSTVRRFQEVCGSLFFLECSVPREKFVRYKKADIRTRK
jgi:hypothetical protein